GELAVARSGRRRLALLGHARPAAAGRLPALLAGLSPTPDLDAAARAVPGAFHLVASMEDGRVWARGTLSTVCQLFTARIGGVPVAADRPDTLAALNGTGVDEELVALRLIAPYAPYPLGERCLWQGVEALPAGHRLRLDPGGHAAVGGWTAPEPEVPLEEGAARVREALHEAVTARTDGGGTLSADLSGGMDSTSLCFLAAAGPARLVTFHWAAGDAANDDLRWADHAMAALPDAEHLVYAQSRVPHMYADLPQADGDLEAPFVAARVHAQLRHLAAEVAAHGSTRHLVGDGGDELFFGLSAYLHSLARTRPLTAVRHVRAARAMLRWRLAPTVRALLDRASYTEWLAAAERTLTTGLPPTSAALGLGWDSVVRLPSWATPEAAESVRVLLREGAEPLSPHRGQHMALNSARKNGDGVRRAGRLSARAGVSWHAPYLDDQVIEAALAVRLEDRLVPDRYKPVLAAAMRDIVPGALLGRPTKAEFSPLVFEGLRRHRRELLDLCDGMLLARMGLVDAGAFRSALLGLHTSSRRLLLLDRTLSCELWLRSVAAVPATTGEAR
ncbi:asparagine synthase-related protein, partial [Spirillospora sp. NPDC029432]|uniref:asparagine synthase-related protein n=1 Tax=Spirillospora sp. NPDC029432 TaxID=3154599 RepID=UPI003456714E